MTGRLTDAAWLRRRYVDDGATVAEIAAETGRRPNSVHKALRRAGVPARGGRRVSRRAVERRLEKGDSLRAIARALDVDVGVVRDRAARWGLYQPEPANPALAGEAVRLYVQEGWPLGRIAAEVGRSKRTVTRMLLAGGVTLRPRGRSARAG